MADKSDTFQNRPIGMMIAGAEKAGTSSLLRYLAQHPLICTHSQRENNYFVLNREYEHGYDEVFPQYYGHCSETTSVIVGKSASLMYLPSAPERLYRHNPSMKVVFLLRHPVERAYSAYWFARRRGWESAPTFEVALRSRDGRLDKEWRQEQRCIYLEHSTYINYITAFYGHYDSDNVYVYLTRDLKTRPIEVCRHLLSSLSIWDSFIPSTTRRYNRAAVARFEILARILSRDSVLKRFMRRVMPRSLRWKIKDKVIALNERKFTPPPMASDTREELLAYFRPFNQRLSQLLDRDLSAWDT